MPQQTPDIDYFSRDFDAIRTDLLKLIPFFTPEWTDRNPSDLGIVLIELFSHAADVLHFYLDRRAQDLYLPSAFTRQSVVNLLKLIDYSVPGKQAATADEQFTITDAPYDEEIEIPRATRLQAPAGTGGEPVSFGTLDEYIMSYTTLSADVLLGADTIVVVSTVNFSVGDVVRLREGTPLGTITTSETLTIESIPTTTSVKFTTALQNSYTTAQLARVSTMIATIGVQEGTTTDTILGQSTGTPWQIVVIPNVNVIEGSIELYVFDGAYELWAEIESLGYADPDEKVYEVSRDFIGNLIIRFGDGAQGKIPPVGENIRSIYRVGGGLIGNVGADKITNLLDTPSSSGGPVSFSVTNPVEASGGAERQSISEAKLLGPKSLRALNRCVTLEDYETLARTVTGVRAARAVQRGSPVYREIDVYIAPFGGYVPTDILIEQVRAYLQERSMAGETVYVQGPTNIVGIILTAAIDVVSTFDVTDVRVLVEAVINSFFAVTSDESKFGKNVNISDLMALIDGVTGVDHVDISNLTLNPADTLIWEIAPTDPAVVDYIIGNNVATYTDQQYTITFTDVDKYVVTNGGGVDVSDGPVILGDVLNTTDGALTILLSVGGDPMAVNDRAVFRTSQYADNVEIEDYEIRQLQTQTLSFTGGA